MLSVYIGDIHGTYFEHYRSRDAFIWKDSGFGKATLMYAATKKSLIDQTLTRPVIKDFFMKYSNQNSNGDAEYGPNIGPSLLRYFTDYEKTVDSTDTNAYFPISLAVGELLKGDVIAAEEKTLDILTELSGNEEVANQTMVLSGVFALFLSGHGVSHVEAYLEKRDSYINLNSNLYRRELDGVYDSNHGVSESLSIGVRAKSLNEVIHKISRLSGDIATNMLIAIVAYDAVRGLSMWTKIRAWSHLEKVSPEINKILRRNV